MNGTKFLLFIICSQVLRIEGLILETKNGRLMGSVQKNIDGGDFYSFKGIPYAKPPVGPLRFRDPEPAESWIGIRNATGFGSKCSQFNSSIIKTSEDCLYLNIYSKSVNSSSRLPVLFWIHGDGLIAGSGDDSFYGPDYFLLKDVVLITINYRLGVFGFLSLEKDVMTGNQGLKDQVMALKWVRDNIAYFGGDPEQVTIFGKSSGGWCVQCPLFIIVSLKQRNVISQSGTVLTSGNYASNTPREDAFQISALLGHHTQDPESIVDFLMKADREELLVAQGKMLEESMKRLTIPFKPTVDAKSKNPFWPVESEAAVKEGVQLPLLIGYTSREALTSLPRVAHADDLHYLFRMNAFERIGLSEPFIKGSTKYWLMEQMIDMWISFATTGNPSTNGNSMGFEPVKNTTHFNYLEINEKMEMKTTVSLDHFYASYGAAGSQ